MDAKTEAEKRYPRDEFVSHLQARAGFESGAAWALREFGDMLDAEAARRPDGSTPAAIALFSWASEAHHIADGIEAGDV